MERFERPSGLDTALYKKIPLHFLSFTAAKESSQEEAGPHVPELSVRDQTTLITDDAQAFALEPIDVTHLGTFPSS